MSKWVDRVAESFNLSSEYKEERWVSRQWEKEGECGAIVRQEWRVYKNKLSLETLILRCSKDVKYSGH